MYNHLFFDLDHTLWDFEQNSYLALESIYFEFDLRKYNILSTDHFIEVYNPINYSLWTAYRNGEIDAETVKYKRFQDTFKQFGVVDEATTHKIKESYMNQLPFGGALMPNTIEMLTELHAEYKLHIVTNGFKEISNQKLKHSGITDYFHSVLSAEEVGVLKPNAKVFETALINNKARNTESLFIGDNLIADVQGAQKVGMDQVFYNPEKIHHSETPTYEIDCLSSISKIVKNNR